MKMANAYNARIVAELEKKVPWEKAYIQAVSEQLIAKGMESARIVLKNYIHIFKENNIQNAF